jgi:hypothetical protein
MFTDDRNRVKTTGWSGAGIRHARD